MSNPWISRTPAFAGLTPDPPEVVPVEAEQADWLRSEVAVEGEVTCLPTSAHPPFGHYRLVGPEMQLFLKVLPSADAAHHAKADALACCVAETGAPAVAPLRWVTTTRGPVIGIYPYVESRYGAATMKDGAALGAALGKLHRALRHCDYSASVRVAAGRRMKMLALRHAEIRAGRGKHGPEPEALRALAADADAPFAVPAHAQIVHGDLNVGNVLFPQQEGTPYFIDFETALVSWLPPAVDVAMAVQRFYLVATAPETERVASARALLDSYSVVAGRTPFDGADALAGTMTWLCLRNLCLLAEAEERGSVVADSEWRKFLFLAQETDAADFAARVTADA